MTAARWRGRRGCVVLGPTENRVARYLDSATRSGRVTIRTVDLAARLGLERSEAYRITRRLRMLGLFGIENDRAGTHGGRRYWRTALEHDGGGLDATRHRDAWARVVGWTAAARRRAIARLHHIRARAGTPLPTLTRPAVVPPLPAGSFADRMRAAGLGPLMDEWRVT